jgi:hypothetical protein
MARGGRPGKKRTQYVRDASGRFASTPGGGPSKATPASVRKAARAAAVKGGTLQSRTSLKRSKAKLAAIDKADETLKTTLSRRAQKGAVTRGQKAARAAIKSSQSKLSVAPKMSVIKKKRKAAQPVLQSMKNETTKAPGQRIRPGEFVRANLRPRNVMAKPEKQKNPYQLGSANLNYRVSATNDDKKARLANAKLLKTMFESRGFSVKYASNRASGSIASFHPVTKEMVINRSHSSHINPFADAIKNRKYGTFSSSSPLHVYYHEMGHAKDKNLLNRSGPMGNMWILATGRGASDEARNERGIQIKKLARRVSKYAIANPSEFIAETYAGRRTGRKYDHEVMSAYREAKGINPNPIVRKLKKKGKTKPNP